MRKLMTSESVTEGHPDKVADKISDGILDVIIEQDPEARVACETLCTTGMVLVAGEITTDCYVDIAQIVRDTVCEIGYTRAKYGFDGTTCAVLTAIDEQSPDIAIGVNQSQEARQGDVERALTTGAGDQGIMYGYATQETPSLMPLPISLAHQLTRRLAAVRKNGALPFLRPDGKSQVTVEYRDGQAARVDTIVISTQHDENIGLIDLQEAVMNEVIHKTVPANYLDRDTKFYINPTGRFVIGGPQGDTGLTGRKIIADTYGGVGRHGGGAFSGKDPTKVDRSASYAARYAAKNLVAAGLADVCEIQLSYAIGVAKPVSLMVDTAGTGVLADDLLASLIQEHFDFRPEAIINDLRLRRPIYKQVAAYGHFGRDDLDLPWEALDKVDVLRQAVK